MAASAEDEAALQVTHSLSSFSFVFTVSHLALLPLLSLLPRFASWVDEIRTFLEVGEIGLLFLVKIFKHLSLVFDRWKCSDGLGGWLVSLFLYVFDLHSDVRWGDSFSYEVKCD